MLVIARCKTGWWHSYKLCARDPLIFSLMQTQLYYIEKDDGEKTGDITQTRNRRIIVDCNLDFVQPSRRRFKVSSLNIVLFGIPKFRSNKVCFFARIKLKYRKTRGHRGPWVAHLRKRSKVIEEPIKENPRGIIWTTMVEDLWWCYILNMKALGLVVSDKKIF